MPCVQQASYLEGGPLMWMLNSNQKYDYDDDMRTKPSHLKVWLGKLTMLSMTPVG